MSLDTELQLLAASCRRAPGSPEPWIRLAEAAARQGAWDLLSDAAWDAVPEAAAAAGLHEALARAGYLAGWPTPGPRRVHLAALDDAGETLALLVGQELVVAGPPGLRALRRTPAPVGAPMALAVHPEGPRLVTRHLEGGRAVVSGWTLGSGGFRRDFAAPGGGPRVWLSPRGDVLALGGPLELEARPWGAESAVSFEPFGRWIRIEDVSFSQDGSVLGVRVYGDEAGHRYRQRAAAYATGDGRRLCEPADAVEAVVTGDGRWLVTAAPVGPSFRLPLRWYEVAGERVHHVAAARRDRGHLAACGPGSAVLVRWQVGREESQLFPGPEATPEPPRPTPGWRVFLPGSAPGRLLIQARDRAVALLQDTALPLQRGLGQGVMTRLAMADGERVMTRESGGIVRSWDLATGAEVEARVPWDHPAPLALADRFDLRWAADGMAIRPRGGGPGVAGRGRYVAENYRLFDVDGAGRDLLLAGSREVMRYDVAEEAVRWRASPGGRKVALVRFHPAGRTAWAYFASNARLAVLDAATGEEREAYALRPRGQGPKAAVARLTWDGDVGYLTVDGAAYRLAEGGAVEVLAPPGVVGARAAVDAASGRVARVDPGGVVRLGTRELGQVDGPAQDLVFSSDGTRLVVLLPNHLRVFSGLPRP